MTRTILVCLLLMLGSGLGGYYYGKGDKEIQIIEKEGRTETIIKDRIITVTRTVRPDGTVIETTKTEEKDQKINEETRISDTSSKPVLSNYSLGLKYWLPISDKIIDRSSYSRDNLEITAGRRLVGEMWLDLGIKLDRSVALGLSVKF